MLASGIDASSNWNLTSCPRVGASSERGAPASLDLSKRREDETETTPFFRARMAKQVDARDLKSLAARHAGSNPAPGTTPSALALVAEPTSARFQSVR